MTDFIAMLQDAIAALAADDPQLQRFGAARHRYARAPVVAAAPAGVPDDFAAYVTRVAGGGVGPYYGLLRVDRTRPLAAPAGVTAWTRALPIAHLGCGYAALIPLDGTARGEVWIERSGSAGPFSNAERCGDGIDARVVAPIYPSFTAYYLDWIDRRAHNRWPEGFVPAGRCPLAAALSGYFAVHEQRLGLAAGALAGADLTAALADLGPGAIAVAGEGPLFGPDDPVDICVTCARLLATLGLRSDVVRIGVAPLPDR
jgi:hypothetical protein